MQSFNVDNLGELFPSYLSLGEKGRLAKALEQFKGKSDNVINYDKFYASNIQSSHFKQGDLLAQIRFPHWDIDKSEFIKKYPNAIILSNTCDIAIENERDIDKQVCFAESFKLKDFLDYLQDKGTKPQRIKEISNSIKRQDYSNLFYMPPKNSDENEYIIFFDRVTWFPIKELEIYKSQNFNETLISTLSHFGHYLMIVKMTYHLCRVPEENERERADNQVPSNALGVKESASADKSDKSFLKKALNFFRI